MKSNAKSLMKSLPAICRAITNSKGVQVVFSGPPRTDGRTIYAGPMPLDASNEQIAIITGDIDHECGHILYTEFAVSKSLMDTVKNERQAFVFNIFNAVEDCRVERQLYENFIGCRETLARSVELIQPKLMEELSEKEISPAMALAYYVDSWARSNVLGQKTEEALGFFSESLTKLIGEKGVSRASSLLSQYIYSIKNTEGSFDLAVRVVKLIEDLAKEEEEEKNTQPEQGQSEQGQPEQGQSEQGQPEQGQSEQGQSEQGQPEQGQSEQGQPEQGQPEQGQSEQGQSEQGQSKQGQPGIQAILADDTGEMKPLFDRSKAAAQEKDVAANSPTSVIISGNDTCSYDGYENKENYAEIKNSVGGAIKEMQQKIVAEYQCMVRRRAVITDEGGRLDGRRLHRAMMGDRRVYRKKMCRMAPYPAVSVVLDRSGSMESYEIRLAIQALIGLAEVNEQINVKTELVLFGGREISIVKPFNAPLAMARGKIGGIHAGGSTPTDRALWSAGTRLASRKEKRKILFLITDGIPDDMCAAKTVSNMLVASGIELYGIGIGFDGVNEFCPAWAIISEPTNIASAVLSALKDRLVRAA